MRLDGNPAGGATFHNSVIPAGGNPVGADGAARRGRNAPCPQAIPGVSSFPRRRESSQREAPPGVAAPVREHR